MEAVLLVVLGALVTAVGAIMVYAAVTTAPFVRTPRAVIRAALRLAGLAPGELLIDLGCGHGHVLVIAAREFGARAVGYEFAPHHAFVAWLAAALRGQGRATVRWGDLYAADISHADVIYIWLTPHALPRLIPKLMAETRPSTRVVAFSSPIPGWEPIRTELVCGGRYRVFLYSVPTR